MKKLLPLLIIVFLVSCISHHEESKEKNITTEVAPVSDGVFVHMTSGPESPHKVLMGFTMAGKMSEDKDVIMYFDIEGVKVLLKDAPDITYSHFLSSKTQINLLLEKGIIIMACPGCLKSAGKSPEDLMDGIIVADKEKFFNFTEGRILTIDY